MNNETLSATFNKLSGKIVNVTEYSQKENALMKQQLTFGEKLFQTLIDAPHQVMGFIFTIFKDSAAHDIYVGKDAAGNILTDDAFLDAKFIATSEAELLSKGLNKKFQEKALKLRFQALEECTDHSSHVKTGDLMRLDEIANTII